MEIGLGLAALGRPGYINLGHGDDIADSSRERMERAAHAVLDAAYDGGRARVRRRALLRRARRRSWRRGCDAAGSRRATSS